MDLIVLFGLDKIFKFLVSVSKTRILPLFCGLVSKLFSNVQTVFVIVYGSLDITNSLRSFSINLYAPFSPALSMISLVILRQHSR